MHKTSQRVKAVRETLGLSQTELAKRMLYSRNGISMIERGVSEPTGRFMAQLEVLEKEAMLKINAPNPLHEPPATYRTKLSNIDPTPVKLSMIPVYSFVQAGQAVDFEALPESWDDVVGYEGNDPDAFALRVSGDSMEPRYSPGTILKLSPRKKAGNGDLVVASIKNEGALFKLFHHSGNGHQITLTSYNPAYPPIHRAREDFHWIYRVVETTHKL